MRSYVSMLSIVLLVMAVATGQTRREISLPDLPGYITLKCDFHMHTPFSDGTVWPTDRVTEAWMEGLDAISITDHVEYQAYKADVKVKHNRSYELALPRAHELDILLVPGAEITRSMPPGHLNALFIEDAEPLTAADPMKAIEEAFRQGAFIFWNHPGWTGQQPDGVARWYGEHTELLEKGWMKGIEVVNAREYYPEVFQWALDNNLTMFGNSDIHSPVHFQYDPVLGQHRPMTLVFAEDRSLAGLREALEAGRTAIYNENALLGKEKYLKPLFEKIAMVKHNPVMLPQSGALSVQLYNHSDLPLHLSASPAAEKTVLELPVHRTVRVTMAPERRDQVYQKISRVFYVQNMLTGPETPLKTAVSVDVLNLHAIRVESSKKSGHFQLAAGNIPEDIRIVYTKDGTIPISGSKSISETFQASGNVDLHIAAFRDGKRFGSVAAKELILHKGVGRNLKLMQAPSPDYAGNGVNPLMDGITGSSDFRDGNWLGFEETDLEAEIDLGTKETVRSLSLNLLQDQRSWIFYPKEINVLTSTDGKSFESAFQTTFDVEEERESDIRKITVNMDGSPVRYLKITAKNQGTCPDWHQGAGGKAWVFVDEIIIQ